MIALTVPCATWAAAATSRCARPSRPTRTIACSYSCSASRLRRAARSTRRRSSAPNSSRARPWPICSASAIAANDSPAAIARLAASPTLRCNSASRSASPAVSRPQPFSRRGRDLLQLSRKAPDLSSRARQPPPSVAIVHSMMNDSTRRHGSMLAPVRRSCPPALRTRDRRVDRPLRRPIPHTPRLVTRRPLQRGPSQHHHQTSRNPDRDPRPELLLLGLLSPATQRPELRSLASLSRTRLDGLRPGNRHTPRQ